MGYLDDKLDIIEDDKKKISSGGPRQYFKKHMHYKDGTPRYEVIEKDKSGIPTKVSIRNRMDGVIAIWNRIAKVDSDYLFEKEINGT